jgi:hypothetical protein
VKRRATAGAVVLLAVHWALAVQSLVRENPTVDEVVHLPAGICYWQAGDFALYHHNPPLIKMIAAIPAILSGARTDGLFDAKPLNKTAVAHEFARLNAADYFEIFTRSRLLMPTFSVVGGIVVFLWSRTLYGSIGGLLSLALWCFCPNILAHARLITTDVAAASLIVGATYVFWLYLRKPTWPRAVGAGLALGVVQLVKFSALLLYGLWPVLWLFYVLLAWDHDRLGRRVARSIGHGICVVLLSVVVIDAGYGFKEVGTPLGQFPFMCRSLTRDRVPTPAGPQLPFDLFREVRAIRVNRFKGTLLESLPVPLPREYLLGFDDQKLEAEGVPARAMDRSVPPDVLQGYPVYLDGELRDRSWKSYYFFAMAYKVPEGTWLLVVASLALLPFATRSRQAWADELVVLTIPFVVLFVMSVFTNINLGLRYVLPGFPFLFISTGKVAAWVERMRGISRRNATSAVGLALAATVASTLMIHPHYLAYFNVVSGGPDQGSAHLIDSNLDWGQDLVNLKAWVDENAPGERVGLAYFGQVPPVIFRERGEPLDWFLPPALPGGWDKGPPPRYRQEGVDKSPGPGLYAVSASLVRGLPWRVYDSYDPPGNPGRVWAPYEAGKHAFSYFQRLKPIDKIGHSIFLYRITPEQAADLARYWK